MNARLNILQIVILVIGGVAAFLGDASAELIGVGLDEAWLRLASKALTVAVTVLGTIAASTTTSET